MSDTVSVLSKSYIDDSDLINALKKIQSSLGLDFKDNRPDTNSISLWQNWEDGSGIEMFVGDKNEFDDTLDEYLINHSSIMCISYYSNDRLLVPFLKELIKTYPDILVYNNENLPVGSKADHYIYSKADIEAVKEDDYWSLLGKSPMN